MQKNKHLFLPLLLSLIFFLLVLSCSRVDAFPQKSMKIFNFDEEPYNFKISPDEKLLAYYSFQSGLLRIVNMDQKKIVWQCFTDTPVYDWLPNNENNVLSYIKKSDNHISLINYNFSTSLETEVFQILDNNSFIYDIWWSPAGNYLAFLSIRGLKDAHGYSQLTIINNQCQYLDFSLDDVYNISWSPDENYLAVTRYIKEDFSQTCMQLINLKTGQSLPFPSSEKIQLNPLFTKDGNGLIYASQNDFNQNLFYYDFLNNKKELLLQELNYISNLSWLTNKNLVFSSDSQILIFNIESKNLEILEGSYLPRVVNHNIYYLKKNSDKGNSELFRYTKEI